MRRRARWVLFSLLLAIGLGAGLLAWSANARLNALARAEQEVASTLDGMLTTTASVAAVQQDYLVAGEFDRAWMAQVSPTLQALAEQLTAIQPRVRAPQAPGTLQGIAERLASLPDADARVALQAIGADLQELLSVERAAVATERAALLQQAWTVVGAAAALWLIGLVLLVRVPPASPAAAALPTVVDTSAATVDEPPLPGERGVAPAPATVDLADAAALCTAISRMTAAVQLPDLLAHAAAVLDASGLIVWMSAGEELFAVTAHGYDPRVISRLGPIGRDADNATALCWRTGDIASVPGDAMSNGAIVAPMFGPDTCIGVLAAEVRHGREADAATRAVTAMIAAQLATAVAAWPAASAAPPAAAAGS